MEYGMVSMLIPKEYESTFRNASKNTMQDAANALQWNLYHGLCTNLGKSIPLFNILPCGSYPQYYCCPIIPKFSFASKGMNLSFCNVKLIRNYFKTKALKKALKTWCESSAEAKTLFVYTISQPFLSAVSEIKKKFPELHICAIVADLPNMSNLSTKKKIFMKIFSARRAQKSYSLLSCVDSFVLLTKYMADYMQIGQPYCVMEGISTDQSEFVEADCQNDNKIVFYAGTLHRKFGIIHLLEAFEKIPDADYRLVLCGTGDCEKEIEEVAKKDNRIMYYGQLPRTEVLKLQVKATVLVNPRLNNEEFTKYSFPSKNLEYLSSGVPLIAYKLDGIPDDYDEYILYPNGESSTDLAEMIVKTVSLSASERNKIGMKARDFVLKQKNAVIQTKKILDLIG